MLTFSGVQPIGGEAFATRVEIWNSFNSFSFLAFSARRQLRSPPLPLGSSAG
jgi:hypothetical protein